MRALKTYLAGCEIPLHYILTKRIAAFYSLIFPPGAFYWIRHPAAIKNRIDMKKMNQAKRIEILTRLPGSKTHIPAELEYNSPFRITHRRDLIGPNHR